MNVNELLGKLLTNIERSRQDSLKSEIAADPEAHKLTGLMSDGKPARYRYVSAKNGRGQTMWFCWSVHRNAAGYFLGWREKYFQRKGKDGTYATRDQWSARKVRNRVMDLAHRRRDKMIEKYPVKNGRS